MMRQRLPCTHQKTGQFVIIYIFGLFTLCLVAFTSLTVGQMLIRKQWAQLIADAGAYAGAAKEAEGLNSISRVSGFEFSLLRWIQFRDRFFPGGYMVSSWKKECTEALSGKLAKKIQKRHKTVDNVWFKPANGVVDVVNTTFRGLAWKKAKDVSTDNFKQFFPREYAANASGFKTPNPLGYAIPLAKLTPYFDESVAWWYWTLDPGPEPVFPGLICTGISYDICDFTGIAGEFGFGDHADQPNDQRPKSSYHFKKVMRLLQKDSETTFLWWVQIPAVRPILGMDRILGHLPPITAIARAKPYGGRVGFNDDDPLNDANEVWPKRKSMFYFLSFPPTAPFGIGYPVTWNVQWHMSKPALQTYKVKFVPIWPIRLREDAIVGAELALKLSQNPRSLLELPSISH